MAIEVKNISYTYPGSTVTAVENVSMKIEKGERVAIIGQNGAGKSTTVKLMNNINLHRVKLSLMVLIQKTRLQHRQHHM